MVCICTFWVYRLERWPKRCLFCTLWREATLQIGSGFRNIDPKEYHQSFWIHSWRDGNQGWFRMRLVVGCHRAKKQADSRTVHPRRETCLWHRGLSQAWSRPMENFQFSQTVEHGIHKHAGSWNWPIAFIPRMGKALLKGQCSTSRTGQCFGDYFPCSKKRVAIPSMSKTGLAHLRQCITRRCQTLKLTGLFL